MSKPSSRMTDLSSQEKRALLTQLLQSKARQPLSVSPLSYGQQALWLTYKLAPESWAYNVVFTARIRSEVNILALQRAFQALLDRHPVLRTTYTVQNDEPAQQIHAYLPLHFEAADASLWSQEMLRERLTAEARRPFDLERGPLMRVCLFTQSATNHALLLTIHHIAIDFWSLGLLLDELRTLYAAEKAGIQASLPPLGQPYTDYVRRQAQTLAGPEHEQLWTYWQHQLGGELPVFSLPTDRPRLPVQTYGGATHPFTLSEELTRQLKAFAKAAGVTLYVTLLAAFHVLLHRYAGQDDILVGTFMAGRLRPEFRRTVGYFVNPVVIRARFSGNPPFTTFLAQVHHTVLEALKYQELPFPLLVERLQPVRDASRSALFQVAFILQQLHVQEELLQCFIPGTTGVQMNFGELILEPFALPQQEGQFDLTLEMAEVGASLWGGLKYNTDLFNAVTISRMAGHFQTLLEGIVTNPDQSISALPLLTETERQQLLGAWNHTTAHYPSHDCLHQLFEAQVERTPEATAVVYEKAQLTYRELNRRANLLAHHLQALGVEPEVLVGICVERSLEMVVGLLGILKAGGAYVPLDPAYPQERLAFMLQDTQVPVLLTQQHLVSALPKHTAHVVCLDAEREISPDTSRQKNPVSRCTPENLAYVIYTSGSTGTPKGVLGLHRGAVNRLAWMWRTYPFHPAEVACQKTSLNFVDSIWELFGPLLQGVRTVIIPDTVLKDPRRLVQTLAAHHVTRIVLVPSLLSAILDVSGTLQSQLPQLTLWITSGEALSVELSQRFLRSMPHSTLLNLYGSSEVSADVTWYAVGQIRTALSSLPIGRPIANTQIYLLDAYQNPVPVGMPGELHAGGVGLARGYLNRSELTSERFIPNPFSTEPGARLYKTGDLARYRCDGNLEFLGRLDQQVKIRGFRIELGEIEVILGQHPAVQEVVVTVQQEVHGDKRLLAYLVPARTPAPAPSALRSFLKSKLPDYMIPSTFVILDAWPLTPNGKVNRLALPAPDQASRPQKRAGVSSRTPVEARLTDIWAQVLGLKQVNIHDNFFELGGHSLLAIQLMSRVHQAFDRDLPLTSLFQAPTIADQALLLMDTADTSTYPLVPIQVAGTQPPLFCMHPAGGSVMVYYPLATSLGPDQPLYGLQSRALTASFQEHDTLDTMAIDYTAVIRAQQPEGPYYLIGWSMGGVLAMTVARLLEHQAQHVAFLGLCDTYLPTHDDLTQDHDLLLGLVSAFGGTMASAIVALAPVEQQALRDELLVLSATARLQRLITWGQERHLLPSDLSVDALRRQAALAETHMAMLRGHTVAPLRTSLHIWWARDRPPGQPPRTDWSKHTFGAIHAEIVEGNHFSMIQPPYVHTLAERIQALCKTARQDGVIRHQ